MATTTQPTSFESNSATPDSGLTVPGIRAAIRPILQRLGETAGVREATHDYAFAEVRALAEAGIALAGRRVWQRERWTMRSGSSARRPA